jgi:predicted amidohydrolase YtcJ
MRTLLFLLSSAVYAQPDLILHNGKVVTVDAKFSIQQAIAIEAGRITAVGTNADVLKLRGAKTRLIDLQGKSVLPGLIDSHVHALGAGLSEYRGEIPPLDSFAAVQAYIRTQAARTPKGEWILVPRTFPTRLKELSMPTRAVLDAASPDHPVVFDASYLWVVNSAGLKKSGITRDTPNPPGGEIVRDANGEPNGILRNASGLVKGLRDGAKFTEAEKLDALEKMLKRYQAAGITAVSDRAVNDEEIALYRQLRKQNRLPVRAVLTWRINAARPTKQVIEEIRTKPFTTGDGDEWLKFGAFKVTLDGGMTIGTAYQRQNYGAFGKQLYGQSTPDRGQLFLGPEKLFEIMNAARAKGWQLTAHSQGGGAIDALLDAWEKIPNLAPTRSHLMHASFQSPEAIARAAKLKVMADVQAAWMYLDGPALSKVFPPEVMRYYFPLRSYLNAGIHIAGGTDHMTGFNKNKGVNPYNPFLSMWIAVSRKTVAGGFVAPEEKITREEALKMYTVWAAEMQFAEMERGTIEVGKFADLTVIDRDYLRCAEDDIRRIEPVMTLVGGK